MLALRRTVAATLLAAAATTLGFAAAARAQGPAPAPAAPSSPSTGAAAARSDNPADTPQGASAPKVKVERSASGQKIFRITEGIVVEGKIQKPNAFYVLQRSSLDYDWESLKQDFLPRILQATTRHPF